MPSKRLRFDLSTKFCSNHETDGMSTSIWLTNTVVPALTDLRGLTVFFCYRRTSVIANKGKEINLKGP